jgi:hypothetical protein
MACVPAASRQGSSRGQRPRKARGHGVPGRRRNGDAPPARRTHQPVVDVGVRPLGRGRRVLGIAQPLAGGGDAATGSHGNAARKSRAATGRPRGQTSAGAALLRPGGRCTCCVHVGRRGLGAGSWVSFPLGSAGSRKVPGQTRSPQACSGHNFFVLFPWVLSDGTSPPHPAGISPRLDVGLLGCPA